MCLQVNRKYNAVLDENRKLKEGQNVLLTNLKTMEERVKELEEKHDKVQEDKDEKPMKVMVCYLRRANSTHKTNSYYRCQCE